MADIDLDPETAQRKDELLQWGFQCSCEVCGNPHVIDDSDRNRRGIQVILNALQAPEEHVGRIDSISEQLLGLARIEGMGAQTGAYCTTIVAAYMRLGDYRKAKEYAKCAVERQRIYAGPEHTITQEAERSLKYLSEVNWVQPPIPQRGKL